MRRVTASVAARQVRTRRRITVIRATGARVSFLQQAVGEHDLDDRGNRLDARPVAL
jgi:hypothetical protein